jgi:lysophospholipase L1-like esterase
MQRYFSYLSLAALAIVLASFCLPQKKIRIFMAGDSTMEHYDTARTPQRGWGQLFHRFFDDRVEIINKARGGRSTKSLFHEVLWQQLVDSLRPGDWVFIEFGHNDHDRRKPERYTPPEDYKKNLIRMASDVRTKGAHPVLLTPIAMRTFNAQGVYHDGHGVYPEMVKEAAAAAKAPLIDLDAAFGKVISGMGPEKSKSLFMNFGPGLYAAYPDGHTDNTHLREKGALEVAALAVQGIKKDRLRPLVAHLR